MPTFYLSTLDRTWGVEIKGWMYFLLGMDREFGNFATLDDLEMNWFFLFSRLQGSKCTSCHVLAAVVTHALAHCGRTTVTYREALSGNTSKEGLDRWHTKSPILEEIIGIYLNMKINISLISTIYLPYPRVHSILDFLQHPIVSQDVCLSIYLPRAKGTILFPQSIHQKEILHHFLRSSPVFLP